MMNIINIITKKRDGGRLNREEIFYFVNKYVNGEIPDYQISALLMAIFIRDIDFQEMFDLTSAMLKSGDIIDLNDISGIKADKHSTGGVGDKTSLVVGPLVASCGVKLSKMSGRGLEYTGGTLDKLEAIPGFNTSLDNKRFKKQIEDIGIAIMGQTKKLVPADKKLYALRDVTGTVENIGLIASSIMSKKLASGADTILLDVKVGSGAFMKTLDKARALANNLVKIGKYFGKDTRALITNMDQPLGYAVGNILEVKEAITTLNNNGPADFVTLCKKCASVILMQAKIVDNENEAIKLIETKLKNGEAFSKFKELVKTQGGDISYIDEPNKFNCAKNILNVYSDKEGYIEKISAVEIGKNAMYLGAGRRTKEDTIDFSAGIVLNKKVGDFVRNGSVLCTIHTNKNDYDDIIKNIKSSFIIVDHKIQKQNLIIDYIQ